MGATTVETVLNTRHAGIVCLILSASLLASCGTYSSGVANVDRPGSNEAFVYGRFSIGTPNKAVTMGLSMSCSDGSKYVLKFLASDPVQVVRVKPATCTVTEIVYTRTVWDSVVDRRAWSMPHLTALSLRPNTAYYLGDFFALAGQTSIAKGSTIETLTTWKIARVSSDFSLTTADMHRLFPAFASVPTQNTFQR